MASIRVMAMVEAVVLAMANTRVIVKAVANIRAEA